MAYQDLREFLARLESERQLCRVEARVDLNEEIGAICRRVLDARGPALWFSHPGDSSIPLVCDLLATRQRYAVALETTVDQIHAKWLQALANPLPPVLVNDGPCKENVILGDDVDLYQLPIPLWNKLDGGPYISFPCHLTKDPATGQRNAGMYRGMVHDRRTIGINAAPYRHITMQRHKLASPQEDSFPVAIAIGLDPVIYIATIASFPDGVDELAMAGALRGEPVKLVPCETIPLEVPATAEIVLEGELIPNRLMEEGLYGEFTGYYGLRVPRPVIEIKAITYRHGAIFQGSYNGPPPQDSVVTLGIPLEAEIMRLVPLPGIKKVHMTEGGCGAFNAVVSIEKPFEGYGKMVGAAVLGAWGGRLIKTVVVVDSDIDPFNPTQVEWAVATRVQPHRDVEIITGVSGMMLDPSLPEHERATSHARTSKMIIDATRYDASNFEKVCLPDREIWDRVLSRWDQYGIELS